VTIKDLQRIVLSSEQTAGDSPAMQDLMQKVRDRPFYIWAKEKHESYQKPNSELKGRCCFNHIIGLPLKNGKPQPLWDYQDFIYRALMLPGFLNSSPNKLPPAHTNEERRERDSKQPKYQYDFKLKHLWIKKATGLGVTEFMLRLMVWLCLRNDDYKSWWARIHP
jgi:hypothetical protein